jgi:cell division transport system permease protein
MMTSFKRILIAGSKNFSRSGLVSFATVLIMTITLMILAVLMFLSALLSYTLVSVQDKVDINVYFTTTTAESDILSTKSKIEALPDVALVSYVSRDEAITEFRAKHADDSLTLQALDQLGENPLSASLAIKAKDPNKYGDIVNYISNGANVTGGESTIERINYYQNKSVIDRLTAAIAATERAGLALVIFFALASAIIAFATVRLAIFSARDEIAVMRLVGASNMYIRGPFIVAGMLAGVIAGILTLLIFFPVSWYAGNSLSSWFGGFNVYAYYVSHFPLLFVSLLGTGVLLGGIASFVAVRRYLRI